MKDIIPYYIGMILCFCIVTIAYLETTKDKAEKEMDRHKFKIKPIRK